MTKQKTLVGLIVLLMIVPSVGAVIPQPPGFSPQCRYYWGPRIDKAVFVEIPDEDLKIRALLDNEIDIIYEPINTSYIPILESAENIEIFTTSANSYVAFTINCQKYPLNITSFRRAFAFALDKEMISEEMMGSHTAPLDSCLPRASPFSAEGQFDFSYYYADTITANLLLDEAGFLDLNEDGTREAPDGSVFSIVIDYPENTESMKEFCEVAVQTLESINISAEVAPSSYNEYQHRFLIPGDYDIAYQRFEFEGLDVEWLGYEYWSEYTNELQYNLPNFQNSTFDALRTKLLQSTEYEEVYNASIEMQRILAFESPLVICYEEQLSFAYRIDRFENFTYEPIRGPAGWWTLCQVRLHDSLGGPWGGTFRIGTSKMFDSFNPLTSSFWESGQIQDIMYDSLIRRGPDGTNKGWLAFNWTIETQEDNPRIPENHTRISLKMDPRAMWSDTELFSAEDVVYTLNLYRGLENHMLGDGLSDLTAIYSPDGETVVVEFDSESFWHLQSIAYKPILPKHFFSSLSDTEEWNPHPPSDELVTLGPFNVSDHVSGEFVEMTYNPTYFYLDPSEFPVEIGPCMYNRYHSVPPVILSELMGNQLSWDVRGGVRENYSIIVDGVVQLSEEIHWNYGDITINIDEFRTGYHNVTLVIWDINSKKYVSSVEFCYIYRMDAALAIFILAAVFSVVPGWYFVRKRVVSLVSNKSQD